jgi:hypothetical protein
LEQFYVWKSTCYKPDEAPPTFILPLTQVVGQARKDQTELEQNAVLNVTHLREILASKAKTKKTLYRPNLQN